MNLLGMLFVHSQSSAILAMNNRMVNLEYRLSSNWASCKLYKEEPLRVYI